MMFPGLSIVSSILLVILVAAARFSSAVPFGFSYNPPKQCGNFTVTWNGGSPPFELLITPRLGLPQIFSLPNGTFDSRSNEGSFSTTLNISSQTIFLMTLSDSAGFGSGGTTAQLTVGSGDSSCTTDNRSADFSFQYNATVQQCKDFFLYNYGNAVQPLTVYGLIPQGSSFVLHPPDGSSSYAWDAAIAAGTNVMFTMVDSKQRLGGTTDIIPVGYSTDTSCLNSTSPTSTGHPALTNRYAWTWWLLKWSSYRWRSRGRDCRPPSCTGPPLLHRKTAQAPGVA
ncbi:hypothetical protein BS47DRAFT_1000035 [Hydnum rufescens UP504]|uniref:Uncharacterized protein n=1 Tax=Hydnum rufescens UP504 TaxID=1448309 RepID=A0A9P6E287_9AGAM|nr:hypothetical protein BS47DRAFT_1000035 [Hydnum rufescens UP504]